MVGKREREVEERQQRKKGWRVEGAKAKSRQKEQRRETMKGKRRCRGGKEN